MKRIGVLFLVTALALIAAVAFPRSGQVRPPRPDASRAATFVGLKDRETLFVERVRDVPGGFHGEVSVTGGTVWVRYRVEVGPDEAVRRYELDMRPMVGARPGDVPRPLLVARRERDSVLIEPERGTAVPGSRLAVPPSAFMGSTEMAMFEQAIRYGLRQRGPRAEFPIISAWTGKHMDAAVVRGGRDKVRLETTQDVWEFTLDGQRRILSGRWLKGSGAQDVDLWTGIRVVRLDPSQPHPLHQPLSIGESPEGRRRDRLDSLFKAWGQQESAFRATLAPGRPAHELAAALDSYLVAFGGRGGAYQAERCLEAVVALRGLPGGEALAERYARRAVACADSHNVQWFGEQGMLEARVRSRTALAGILVGLDRRDTAIVLLEAAKALPREYDPICLRGEVLMQLGNVFAAEERTDEAISALFEAVALDTTRQGVSEPLRRSLTDLWKRKFPADTTLGSRISRAHGLNWPTATMGGGGGRLKGATAPTWSGLDLGGRRHSSRAGRPLVMVFWGGWSGPGLKLVRLAEAWHRQRAETGVDVVTFDWELPGRGSFSERIARRAARAENLTLPVLLDPDREIWTRFGGEGFPQAFFVDRQGRMVRTAFGGAWGADTLSAWVEALGRDELR